MKKDLQEFLDEYIDVMVDDHIKQFQETYKDMTISEIKFDLEHNFKALSQLTLIGHSLHRQLETQETKFIQKEFNIKIIDKLNSSITWRYQILDKLFYQLSGHDIIGELDGIEVTNEQLDDIIKHFKSKFDIEDWSLYVKESLRFYFENNEIKDKDGKIGDVTIEKF